MKKDKIIFYNLHGQLKNNKLQSTDVIIPQINIITVIFKKIYVYYKLVKTIWSHLPSYHRYTAPLWSPWTKCKKFTSPTVTY